METALQSKPMFGKKLKPYQIKAQKALPILVRQAQAGTPIYYSDLAKEMGMPNPRNLNYVLGSVGQTLILLEKKWNEKIPMIQSLVINKNTGSPGQGIDEFLSGQNFKNLSAKQQKALIDIELQKVFLYQKWNTVLDELQLHPLKKIESSILKKASSTKGGGESDYHKNLKKCIASHPEILGLPNRMTNTKIESNLPSGDTIDILFIKNEFWFGIEVKSQISDEADIVRGLYQCIKYKAVIDAYMVTSGLQQNSRIILALGGCFPSNLIPLKNSLGIEVIDNLKKYC